MPRASKKKAPKKITKSKLKAKAKRAGRKIKKEAKTDVGRAGIGAGAGALLLGPIGAVAGAYAGLKTRKKSKKDNPGMLLFRSQKAKPRTPPRKTKTRTIYKMDSELRRRDEAKANRIHARHKAAFEFLEGRDINQEISPRNKMYKPVNRLYSELAKSMPHIARNNPEKNSEPMVKVSSTMGSMLIDYYKASRDIENVAARALSGEKVQVSSLIRARDKMQKLYKDQPVKAEKEQIENLVEAMNKIIDKARKANPGFRAFSLETQLKRQRRSKTKKAISRSSKHGKVAGEVSRKSMRRKLAAINPGTKQLEKLTEDYRKTRDRWYKLAVKRTPGMIDLGLEVRLERAKRKAEAAEKSLVMYASVIGIDPKDFEDYMAHALAMEGIAKTRKSTKRKAAKRKPAKKKSSKRKPAKKKVSKKATARSKLLLTPRPGKRKIAADLAEMDDDSLYDLAFTLGGKMNRATQAQIAKDPGKYLRDEERMQLYGAEMDRRPGFKRKAPRRPNPTVKVTEKTPDKKFRAAISRNIAIETHAGRPQNQAVAIALSMARAQAPVKTEKLYGPAPARKRTVARGKVKKSLAKTMAKRKSKNPSVKPASPMEVRLLKQRETCRGAGDNLARNVDRFLLGQVDEKALDTAVKKYAKEEGWGGRVRPESWWKKPTKKKGKARKSNPTAARRISGWEQMHPPSASSVSGDWKKVIDGIEYGAAWDIYDEGAQKMSYEIRYWRDDGRLYARSWRGFKSSAKTKDILAEAEARIRAGEARESKKKGKARKHNPCIGLHFHGKDANEILEAVEKSALRQQKAMKKNPQGKTKPTRQGFNVLHLGIINGLMVKRGKRAEMHLRRVYVNAVEDLEGDGLVEIVSVSKPYTEYGEKIWDVDMKMTPKGRAYYDKHDFKALTHDVLGDARRSPKKPQVKSARASNPKKGNPQRMKKGLVVQGWLVSEYSPRSRLRRSGDLWAGDLWSEPVVKLTKGNLSLVLRRSMSAKPLVRGWDVKLYNLETGRGIESMADDGYLRELRGGVGKVVASAIRWVEYSDHLASKAYRRNPKKGRKKNPIDQLELSHLVIMNRLMAKGRVKEQFLRTHVSAVKDLEKDGLVEVVEVSKPYTEDGTKFWDVDVKITREGKAYYKKHDLGSLARKMSERAMAGMRGKKGARKKNPATAGIDWDMVHARKRAEKERLDHPRHYGTFGGKTVVALAKWTHSYGARRAGIKTAKDRLEVIKREAKQGKLRATPEDCRKAKEIARMDSFKEELRFEGPSFYGDLKGFIEDDRVEIEKRISKSWSEREKKSLRKNFEVRKKSILAAKKELDRIGDRGITTKNLIKKVRAESGAESDAIVKTMIKWLRSIGFAEFSDRKWRAVSPSPKKKNPKKKVKGSIVYVKKGDLWAGPYHEPGWYFEGQEGWGDIFGPYKKKGDAQKAFDEEWDASGVDRHGRPRAGAGAKKNPKKKVVRKKTPPYQLLINRCQKLWTHYCERPSKKRLEDLYVHLDKMKESTSKKVATERSRCLRAANAEAKKLKYKRK